MSWGRMTISGKFMALLACLLLPVAQAQAGYGAEAAVPFLLGAGLTSLVGPGVGVTVLVNGGPSAVGVTLIMAGGGTSTWLWVGIHKELVHQLKVDHDTYLAGGEMTPFLQGVYREIRARTQGFDAEGGGIDEDRVTQAIERLVAWGDTERGIQ